MPTKVDWDKAKTLFSLFATQEETASVLDTTKLHLQNACPRDLGKTIGEFQEECKALGRTRLRTKQLEVAMSGNPTMLIWLGKNELGQQDNVKQELSGPNGAPLSPPTIQVSFVDAGES